MHCCRDGLNVTTDNVFHLHCSLLVIVLSCTRLNENTNIILEGAPLRECIHVYLPSEFFYIFYTGLGREMVPVKTESLSRAILEIFVSKYECGRTDGWTRK